MSKDPSLADLAQLRLRHPDYFKAGSLHNNVDFWEDLIFSTGYTCPQVNLLQIIREGVRVDSSYVISRATLKENVMTRLFRQFLFSRNLLVAIS